MRLNQKISLFLLLTCLSFGLFAHDSLALIPSDTYYTNQWYLGQINAVNAWDKVRESPDKIIAVIDSGVQINHPDLVDNIWVNTKEIPDNGIDDDHNGYVDDVNGWDFVNNVADPSPKFIGDFTEAGVTHGTVIAGIVAASGNNATGITGVTWRAKIMPLKVLDDKGEGNTNSIVKAIDYAINNGADIINLSFTGMSAGISLERAIKRAYDNGLIVVAAAGNELNENGGGVSLDQEPLYPVCYDTDNKNNLVLGVAATDTLDQKAPFSSYGYKCVDIAAPGISVYGTTVYAPNYHTGDRSFNTYYDGYWSGTSMATPMVSGALALIETANPGLNRKQIIDILLKSADDISKLNPNYIGQLGSGRLNIAKAVNMASELLKKNKTRLISVSRGNLVATVRITDADGKIEKELRPFGNNFYGGLSLATGDINGDGNDEFAVATLTGEPRVKIFNAKGELIKEFLAFDKNYRGGINLALGDINNDGNREIIVAARAGMPVVRFFNQKGERLKEFLAYAKNMTGGVNLASGDLDGDGADELVTGAGLGFSPMVRVFKQKNNIIILNNEFAAFDKKLKIGVNVAVANLVGGTRADRMKIVVAPAGNATPQVKIFARDGKMLNNFFAYDKRFKGGVTLADGDINQDGFDEIVTGVGPGGAPHVRTFTAKGVMLNSFYAYDAGYGSGVSTAILKTKL